jgi:hypothetical protein
MADLRSELERELLGAADAHETLAIRCRSETRMIPGSLRRADEHQVRAAALRARAEKVRLFPRVLSGEVRVSGVVTAREMLNWLTGPLSDTETPGRREMTEPSCAGIREDDGFHGTEYVHCSGCRIGTNRTRKLFSELEEAAKGVCGDIDAGEWGCENDGDRKCIHNFARRLLSLIGVDTETRALAADAAAEEKP